MSMSMFLFVLRRGIQAGLLLASLGPLRSQLLYVANHSETYLSVIDTATNMVVGSPIQVGQSPLDLAITPDGSRAYVVLNDLRSASSVAVLDLATRTVIARIPLQGSGTKVAITPDGKRVYVASYLGKGLTVIDTATNTIVPMRNGAKDHRGCPLAESPADR